MFQRLALGLLAALFITVAHAQTPLIPGDNVSTRVAVANSSGNVAAATATATLPAMQGKTTYICGFQMTAGGSTAVSTVTGTVSNVVGGPLSYEFSTNATVDSPSPPLVVAFTPCLPATAQNTTIVVSFPALGAGNTHTAVSANGYQYSSF